MPPASSWDLHAAPRYFQPSHRRFIRRAVSRGAMVDHSVCSESATCILFTGRRRSLGVLGEPGLASPPVLALTTTLQSRTHAFVSRHTLDACVRVSDIAHEALGCWVFRGLHVGPTEPAVKLSGSGNLRMRLSQKGEGEGDSAVGYFDAG